MMMGKSAWHRAAGLFLLLAAACGDDAASPDDGDDVDAGGDGSDAAPSRADRWLVQTTVETPGGRTAYVQTVPSIDVEEIDNTSAIEIAGNGRVYFHDPDILFLGSSESPAATRFTIEDSGDLAEGDALSFADAGFGYLPYGNTFASADRALLLDGASRAGMAWNPAEGTVGEFIDLSSLAREGFEVGIDPGIVREGRLFVPLQYTNPASLAIFPGVAVAVLDIETASVTAVITDERCIGGYTGLEVAEDGTIYIVGDGFAGVTRRIDETTPATCLLRILPGQEEFDPEWILSFPEVLGGREAASAVYAGQGVLFAAAIYLERVETDPFDVFGYLTEDAARWWRVDLETGAGQELDMPYHSVGQSISYVEDGRVLLAAPEEGYTGATPLFEVDRESGAVTQRARFSGLLTELEHVARD